MHNKVSYINALLRVGIAKEENLGKGARETNTLVHVTIKGCRGI
jgi:hypothetical protein